MNNKIVPQTMVLIYVHKHTYWDNKPQMLTIVYDSAPDERKSLLYINHE
jgi:hypothetical protein